MLSIAARRLRSQHLAHTPFDDPVATVAWLGAVQAQDFAGARWAVGLRTAGATDAALQPVLDSGRLLRTHVLRPTWHFVAPADIGWLLAVTGPRVRVRTALRRRELGLDAASLRRSRTVLVKVLRGGRHATRAELIAAFERAGIATGDQRFAHIMLDAELEGLVCSGAWRGKQATHALLDERVPPAAQLDREAALAELARRYFTSRGPATLADFVWWSSVTVADARAAIALAGRALASEQIDGVTCWSAAGPGEPAATAGPRAHLLPNYDEYTVGYRDRSAVFDARRASGGQPLDPRAASALNNAILVDGHIVGTWRRSLSQRAVAVHLQPFAPLTAAAQRAVLAAAERYAAFLGVPLDATSGESSLTAGG